MAFTEPIYPVREVHRRTSPSQHAALTAAEGIRALQQGTLTCEAWTAACLDRIDARNPEIKAWVHVAGAQALGRARNLDKNGRHHLFDGVPLGIKDTIDTVDMPTELGDPEIFPCRQPKVDAPVVQTARNLGFTLLGKNTVSRHAIMLAGPCRNPHDITRTPGASSAGSAAAVADFMVPISIGTQTAGSILRPSSFCGAVGFKPTLNLIPYVGIRTYSRPLDVVGPICRSVEDAMLFMSAFARDPRFNPERPVSSGLRIGIWRPADLRKAEPYIRTIFEDNLSTLSAAGMKLVALNMPPSFDEMGDVQDVIMAYDLAREYAAIKRDHSEKCDRELLDYLEKGDGYASYDYAVALDKADACRRIFYDVARDVDVIAMPTTVNEAPPAVLTGSSTFIRIWSLLHNPAITLPVARGPGGLPVGLQLVGFVNEDARLLYCARCIEHVLGNLAHQV